MGEGVPCQGIGAEFEHKDIGAIGLDQGQDQRLEGILIDHIVGPDGQRDVYAVSLPRVLTDFVHESRPGKEDARIFVQGDRHHIGPLVDRIGHSIPVVHINIQINDSLAGIRQSQTGDRHIVDVTESGGLFRPRVMESPGGIECHIHLPGKKLPCRKQRHPGREHRMVKDTFEQWAVRGSKAHAHGLALPNSFRRTLKGVKITRRMHFLKIHTACRFGGFHLDPWATQPPPGLGQFARASGPLGIKGVILGIGQGLQFRTVHE